MRVLGECLEVGDIILSGTTKHGISHGGPFPGLVTAIHFKRSSRAVRLFQYMNAVGHLIDTGCTPRFVTFDITRRNEAEVKQVVILKGNPAYVENNNWASDFYIELEMFLMELGCDVITLPGTPGIRPDRTHPDAKLWVGHSMGTERLRFAGPGVRTVMLSVPEGFHHPEDDACILERSPKGWKPNQYHYTLTLEMEMALRRLVDEM